MRHLDELSARSFVEIKGMLEESIKELVNQTKGSDMCPACICHMIAEVARNAAKGYEKQSDKHNAKAH